MTDATPPPAPKREINWTAVLTLVTAIVGLLTALIVFLRETNQPVSPVPPTATLTVLETRVAVTPPANTPTVSGVNTATPGGSGPVPSRTLVRTATQSPTAPAYTATPATSNGPASFGAVRNVNGLLVSLGGIDLSGGCNGTLDFELALTNTTAAPIVLGFSTNDIKMSGDGQIPLSVTGDTGPVSPRCYGSFTAATLAPGSRATYALRIRDDRTRFKTIDLTFGTKAGRLADLTWRLDLTAAVSVQRPPFGQTLISADGVEAGTAQDNYFPGCSGTLGFMITLRNNGARDAALMLSGSNLHAYGDGKTPLSISAKQGAPTAECYSSFNLPSLNAGQSVSIAARVRDNLATFTWVDIVFEGTTRLAGLRWRLQLPH